MEKGRCPGKNVPQLKRARIPCILLLYVKRTIVRIKSSPNDSCSTIPALSNSDHLGLMVELSFKSTRRNPKGRVVWRYSHADWDRACNLIEAIDWLSLLDPTDINRSWTQWSKALSIMEKCIPKATLPRRKNRPWLSKKILQAM